jgi:tetratricopeptide (TPR) repeat protein
MAPEHFTRSSRRIFRKSEYLDYAYTGLGDIAFAEKQYEKAMENYDTALEKVGATFKLKEATVGKAKALLELGRFDESKKLFEQVASIKEWRGRCDLRWRSSRSERSRRAREGMPRLLPIFGECL